VTVVPVLIVRLAGPKAKFLISIAFGPPEGAGVAGVVVDGLFGEVQPENRQVKTSRITHAARKIPREGKVIVSLKGVRNKKKFLPDSIKQGARREMASGIQRDTVIPGNDG
jgi:hypothetical protein